MGPIWDTYTSKTPIKVIVGPILNIVIINLLFTTLNELSPNQHDAK